MLPFFPIMLVVAQEQAPTSVRALESLLRELSERVAVKILADATLSGARVVPPHARR